MWVEKAKEFMLWKAENLGLSELAADWVLFWLEEKGEVFCESWLSNMALYCCEEGFVGQDHILCPFCYFYKYPDRDCEDCEWGAKHGICDDDGSWYMDVSRPPFKFVLGHMEIAEKLRELCR